MITEMYMPKNGMDMTEGTIIKWLKEVGDQVEADEPIMEIETDKITMEAEAPGGGVLLKKLYDDGATVPVLTVIGYIGEPGDPLPDTAAISAKAEEQAERPAARMEGNSAAKRTESSCAATPYARYLASEENIDLSCIAPTGSEGQILGRDVTAAANSTGVARAIAARTGAKLNLISGSGEGGRVTKSDLTDNARKDSLPTIQAADQGSECCKLTPMRKVIAKRMTESHVNIPTVTQNTCVNVTRLVSLRKELNEDKGTHISINDFVIRATALALTGCERLRMQFSESMYSLHNQINIGVAVSVEDGLLVPVVRDADKKSLVDISEEMKAIAAKARSNKLCPDEVGDARITITNLGMYGVHSFTPIINEPECAILGVCAIEDYLAFNDKKEIENRKRMMLCLTFDHRILNGTEAAKFANEVKRLLEHPYSLLN